MSQVAELERTWVSPSETQPERSELSLRTDVREIAERLDAVREAVARHRGQSAAARRDVRRLFEAFTREIAAELATEGTSLIATGPLTFEHAIYEWPASGWHLEPEIRSWRAVTTPHSVRLGEMAWNVWALQHQEAPLTYPSEPGLALMAGFAMPTETMIPLRSETEASPERNPAQVAFRQLKEWLGTSDEETSEIAGIGRTTPYSWERGRVPRASTVRTLYEIRELVAGLVHARGAAGLQEWLNQIDADGATPLELLLSGRIKDFRRRVQDALFPIRQERPRSVSSSFEPEPDLDLSGMTDRRVKRARRSRHKRDR